MNVIVNSQASAADPTAALILAPPLHSLVNAHAIVPRGQASEPPKAVVTPGPLSQMNPE